MKSIFSKLEHDTLHKITTQGVENMNGKLVLTYDEISSLDKEYLRKVFENLVGDCAATVQFGINR